MRIIPEFSSYDGGPSFIYQAKIFYKCEEKLGSGTFGEVFRFESNDRSQFSVKSELIYAGKYCYGAEFQKEAEWYQKIYGVGVFSGNAKNKIKPHYILMPFFEGKTLYAVTYDSVKEVFYRWLKTANAVNQLHQKQGLVHCDLKTDNVIIGKRIDQKMPDASPENAFIIDFGCLTPVDSLRPDFFYDSLENKARFYHQPPEIFLCQRKKIKAHPMQDVYALGILLRDIFRIFVLQKHGDRDFFDAKNIVRTIKENLTHQDFSQRWPITKAIYMVAITFFSRISREILVKQIDDECLNKLDQADLLPSVWRTTTIAVLQMHIDLLTFEQKNKKSKKKEHKINGLRFLQSEIKISDPKLLEKMISDTKIKFPDVTAGIFSRRTKMLLVDVAAVTPVFY
ncbi:MAG: hypothetical protein A3E82_07210 [Gammaproteobacteria bacterium RIFCSPHIGHO2_12_FULL_38_11]|nr:MAG: hypothetical protein A3E82_07210 [Gammaproteobacteria bacterium RIFCSPHIGHO2_12_FULL_38_11]